MIIKPSTSLRNHYSEISSLVRDTNEPIYITNHGESDIVILSVEAYEAREQELQLRSKVLAAEDQRLSGSKTLTIHEAKEQLDKRLGGINEI